MFICIFPFDQYVVCILKVYDVSKKQEGEIKDATKSGVAGKSNFKIRDENISIVFCISFSVFTCH